MQRKGLADGGDRAQPVRADHLIDEHQMIAADNGKIDGLLQFGREPDQKRPRRGDEVGARRGGQPQDGRAEPHPAVRRGRNQEFFGRERGDDALHRRARELYPLRNLAEAQPVRFDLPSARKIEAARAIT